MTHSNSFFARPTEYTVYLRWFLLFIAIVGAIYTVTQTGNATLLTLFIVSYTFCLNFSIPTPVGHITFVPLLALLNLILLGQETTLIALLSSMMIAELLFPVWRPLWHRSPLTDFQTAFPRIRFTLVQAAVYTTTLYVSAQLAPLLASIDLLPNLGAINFFLTPLYLSLFLVYSAIYLTIYALTKPILSFTWSNYFSQAQPYLILSLLLLPTVTLAAILYQKSGLTLLAPALIIFLFFNFLYWAAWQNSKNLRQQIQQLARLNEVAEQQRETLDIQAIVQRSYEQIKALIELDEFTVFIDGGNETWHKPIHIKFNASQDTQIADIDSFTRWVINHCRILDIDRSTIHYAKDHHLTPPDPLPYSWLGIPLTQDNPLKTIGVMVLQQHTPDRIIDRWRRELLSAIVRQTSDGIENAMRHGETVRLYTQTDAALAQRVEQLQAILNTTSDAIVLISPTGEQIMANLLAQDLSHLGYTPSERQTLHQTLPDHLDKEMIQLAENHDNQPRWFERSTAPVYHAEQLLGWLIVLHDVTAMQERAVWREQFTSMVVHDLRNPITTILTTLDLIGRRISSDPTPNSDLIPSYLQTGRRASHHMLDLVDSLMDATRLAAGQLIAEVEAMHLKPQIEQVIQQMTPQLTEKELTLNLHSTNTIPAIWADEELVRRVVANLLDNAFKFTPRSGRITITLEPNSPQSGHEAGIICAINDTGPGIPPSQRQHIFDRFVRIAPNQNQIRGTGLGLSFCQQALEIQNGRIWVEEGDNGIGSKFIFTLPGPPHFDLD